MCCKGIGGHGLAEGVAIKVRWQRDESFIKSDSYRALAIHYMERGAFRAGQMRNGTSITCENTNHRTRRFLIRMHITEFGCHYADIDAF